MSSASHSPYRGVIIMPAYNEAAHLAQVLKAVTKSGWPVVVVDDGSPDNTSTIARHYAQVVLRHPVNLGKGAALRTGCDWVRANMNVDGLIFMDADEQHSATDLPYFQQALQSGAQLVLGVRDMGQAMPRYRRWGNTLLTAYVHWRYGVRMPDILSGYKAMSMATYQRLRWHVNGYEVEFAMALQAIGQRVPFQILPIKTIYHSYERGMNILDALRLIGRIPGWSISENS